MPLQTASPPVKLFISYSHRNDSARKRLQTFLVPLERKGTITVLVDRRVDVGKDWDREIKKAVETAELIVLLLSADFLASDYIDSVEMRIAHNRHKEGTVEILPIVVGECQWSSTWLGDLNVALNGRLVRGGKPGDKWWNQVVDIIGQKVKQLRPFQVHKREFDVIERFAEDIRGDYATRTEEARSMNNTRVDFADTDFYARLEAELQGIRAAIKLLAQSPIGQDLSSRMELLEVENARRHVTVAIVGQVKAGKSTLVNVLARQDLSPRDVDAMTAFPIRVRSGDSKTAFVAWRDGTLESFVSSELEPKMEELRLSGRRDHVRELVVTTPRPLLSGYGWIEMLDTPGLDGWRREDTERTVGLIGRAVAVVLVYRHSQASSESFLELVEKLRRRDGLEVFSVCNSDPTFRDLNVTVPEQLRRSMGRIEEQLRSLGARHHVIDLRAALNNRLACAVDESQVADEPTDIKEFEQSLCSILRMRDVLAFRENLSKLLYFCDDCARVCEERAAELRAAVELIEAEIKAIRDQERELLGLTNTVHSAAGELLGPGALMGAMGTGVAGGLAIANLVTTAIPVLWPLAVGSLVGSIIGGGIAAIKRNENKVKFLEHLTACKSHAAASDIVSPLVKARVAAMTWELRLSIPQLVVELRENATQCAAAAVATKQSARTYIEYTSLVSGIRMFRSELDALAVLDNRASQLLAAG